ncbi:S8 family serine peptidase [Gracilimonas mengyeensis]|uniref:Por secretion system C-terminal sorting domain-containing protein n=1 Tax=Gracilimonas mengyeensis TaxID=1302730 RepID=A0A521BTX4_9BACT|nr:S8 family serine peptidase [Gracilimonas mengyeensis]SMO50644.1 Por secretion system C-terminal sorting domain-containing protein [Gracilimonas mengyeensis]
MILISSIRIQILLILVSILFIVSNVEAQSTQEYVPGEMIVKYKSDIPDSAREVMKQNHQIVSYKKFKLIEAELWRVSKGIVPQALNVLNNNPNIEYAEPNYILRAIEAVPGATSVTPNDPSFNNLWGLNNDGQTEGTADADIDAPEAWDITTGSDQIIIGVIDSGVDYTHEDLSENMWVNEAEIPGNGIDDDGNGYIDDVYGYDFWNDDGDPYDVADGDAHGTHVAGTIAAVGDNGIGVTGVNWEAKIMALKFLGPDGGNTSDAISALEYAIMMGAHITSNSWGGGGYSQALSDAIEAAGDAGQLFIAAAGNGGADNIGDDNDLMPHYPSSYDLDNVIAVASTTDDDALSGFSNYGAISVDLAAPGSSILSTTPGDTYSYFSGTSMATPHVTGVAALILSQDPELSNNLVSYETVRDKIFNSVELLPALEGKTTTGGRLNAFQAVGVADTVKPGTITDLSISDVASTSVLLKWSATGDDGTVGSANRYDIRHSTQPISEVNFSEATEVNQDLISSEFGEPEVLKVSGLEYNTTYHFAIKAYDEWENESEVSNVPSTTTLGIPTLSLSADIISVELLSGQTSVESLNFANSGDGVLEFSFPAIGALQLLNQPNLQKNDISNNFNYQIPAKGENDTRKGNPVVLGGGGPDLFGYRWIDSDEIGGPVFNWVDISETGTSVNLGDDDYIKITLPFEFPFYGVSYSEAYLTSNGLLSFDDQLLYVLANTPIPDSSGPNNLIAMFWDDLNPSEGGEIFYEYHNESGQFIIQFNEITHYSYDNDEFSYTFQALLSSNGTIKLQFQSMSDPTNTSTIGLENTDGTDGLQVVFNSEYVHDELAISFSKAPQFITDINPVEASLAAGDNTDVDFTFDVNGLETGEYTSVLDLASNDPNKLLTTIEATVDVTGIQDIAVSDSYLDFGEVFVDETGSQILTVYNEGTHLLSVTDIILDVAEFSIDTTSFDLSPGDSVDVEVIYYPESEGTREGTLTINSDDPDESEVEISLVASSILPPIAVVTPEAFNVEMVSSQTKIENLHISNVTGGSDLNFNVQVRDKSFDEFTTKVKELTKNGPLLQSFSNSEYHHSFGKAPQSRMTKKRAKSIDFKELGVLAYGAESLSGQIVSFDLGEAEILTPIGGFPNENFPGGGTLDGSDPTIAYHVEGDELYKTDLETGAITYLGSLDVPEGLSGMTYDPFNELYYGISTDIEFSYLYIIDIYNATSTLIGEVADVAGAIALSVAGDGNLYTYDIVTDQLFVIDKETAEASAVGPIGFDANFGQGMSYDAATDIMYMAAFNIDSGQPELRAVNLETGNTTLLGVLGGEEPGELVQISWLGTVTSSVPEFVHIEPTSGVIPAGDEQDLEVFFGPENIDLDPGVYRGEIQISTNDPVNSEFIVDIELAIRDGGDITIRDLNTYNQLNSVNDIPNHPLAGEEVIFTAVIVSHPKNSGLAGYNPDTDMINRLHTFVVDTSANTMGKDGMYMQVVSDGEVMEQIEDFRRGDIVTITGIHNFFNNEVQLVPTNVEFVGSISDGMEEYADLLEPTVITTDELNQMTGDGQQINLDNYTKYVNRYVKVESATVEDSKPSSTGTPWFYFQNSDGQVYFRSTSLRYENKWDQYRTGYNLRREEDGVFDAPIAGSEINISGFVELYHANTDQGGIKVNTTDGLFSIAPWDDGVLWTEQDGSLVRTTPQDWPDDLEILSEPGTPPVKEYQEVTVRELNTYDQLNSVNDIPNHPKVGEDVTFTAVILSEPKNSGYAGYNPALTVDINRLHTFVVDTSANTSGKDGMYMHVVSYFDVLTQIEQFTWGDVVRIKGRLAYYLNEVQFEPDSVIFRGDVFNHFPEYQHLLEPTIISADALIEPSGSGFKTNLENYTKYVNRYVHIEQTTVEENGSLNNDGNRPWFYVNDGGVKLYTKDMSLRYRNDRNTYRQGYNFRRVEDGAYVPPEAGETVNLRGFVTFVESQFDPAGLNADESELFTITPWDDGVLWQEQGGEMIRTTPDGWPDDLNIVDDEELNDDFTLVLTVSDDVDHTTTLTIGTAPDATTGYDAAYDQYAPPAPPTGAFDARIRFGDEDYLRFYQPTTSTSTEWPVRLRGASGTTSLSISWDPSALPEEGVVTLSSPSAGINRLNMAEYSHVNISEDELTDIVITHSLFEEYEVSYAEGWNLVGLALEEDHEHFSELFSDAISGTLFGFDGTYYVSDTLGMGEGYWLRFSQSEEVSYTGTTVDKVDRTLQEGWNLISGHAGCIPSCQLEDSEGIVIPGTMFGFNGVYQSADGLNGGHGYWLRTSDAGTVSIEPAPLAKSKEPSLQQVLSGSYHQVQVHSGDQQGMTLYFGETGAEMEKAIDNQQVILPPLPPKGAFDARLNSDRWWLARDSITIKVQQAEVPVTFTLGFSDQTSKEVFKLTEYGGQAPPRETVLEGGRKLQLQSSTTRVIVQALTELELLGTPEEYQLLQNYPNPFNPETTIRYALPEKSEVRVEIFNVMGQLVQTLVNEEQSAGFHEVRFDASMLSSGMYLYRIKAEDFVQTKRMVLLK